MEVATHKLQKLSKCPTDWKSLTICFAVCLGGFGLTSNSARDLAAYVFGRIKNAKKSPRLDVLESLFQTAFLASLRTEEQQFVRFSISFANPKAPDPDPPSVIRSSRWKFFPLRNSIDYTAANLTKLALAADPMFTSIAVFPGRNGKLRIWGFFDLQECHHLFLTHEGDSCFSPPGVIQVQVHAIGSVIVYNNLSIIAELNHGNLIEDSIDVIKSPTILRKFQSGFRRRLGRIVEALSNKGHSLEASDVSRIHRFWIELLQRVLLRARGIGHGGAFLVCENPDKSLLQCKYEFDYPRLPDAFECLCIAEHIYYKNSELVLDSCDNNQTIDRDAYFNAIFSSEEISDAKEAVAGAIGMIASLSRVDGVVLLDSEMVVRGFGCEIKTHHENDPQLIGCKAMKPLRGKTYKLDLQKYGTRHRSMARYCDKDANAVGFVISSDGPVRCISRHGKQLCFWDNIQLKSVYPFSECE